MTLCECVTFFPCMAAAGIRSMPTAHPCITAAILKKNTYNPTLAASLIPAAHSCSEFDIGFLSIW